MRIMLLLCATLLPAIIAPAAAEEQKFIVRLLPSGEDIAISGPITQGLGAAFRAALAKAPKARLVRLESNGGTLDVATDLYLAIRERKLDTAVQGNCASACTIVFMAGQRRFASPAARFGFHSAGWPIQRDEFPIADFMMRGLYLQAGMADWFADKIMATPHAEMWQPTLDELRRATVITNIGIPN